VSSAKTTAEVCDHLCVPPLRGRQGLEIQVRRGRPRRNARLRLHRRKSTKARWFEGLSRDYRRAISYPYEVRSADEYFDDIQDVKVSMDMLDLARHIVNQKAGHFEPR
jgi:hypothetical protein